MKDNQGLMIIRKKKLTKGQTALFELINYKIEANEKIFFVEAHQIWLDRVCRNKLDDGTPCYYNFWLNPYTENGIDKWKGGWSPMSESEITSRVSYWLVSNIGILVLKGYLRVIPQIEIKQIL